MLHTLIQATRSHAPVHTFVHTLIQTTRSHAPVHTFVHTLIVYIFALQIELYT